MHIHGLTLPDNNLEVMKFYFQTWMCSWNITLFIKAYWTQWCEKTHTYASDWTQNMLIETGIVWMQNLHLEAGFAWMQNLFLILCRFCVYKVSKEVHVCGLVKSRKILHIPSRFCGWSGFAAELSSLHWPKSPNRLIYGYHWPYSTSVPRPTVLSSTILLESKWCTDHRPYGSVVKHLGKIGSVAHWCCGPLVLWTIGLTDHWPHWPHCVPMMQKQ